MLIHDFLTINASAYPHKICVVHEKRTSTFQEILIESRAIAATLQSLAVKKGDRVGLLLRNSIEYITSYYGTLLVGAVTVPINTGISREGLANIIAATDMKVLFTESRFDSFLPARSSLQALVSTAPIDKPLSIEKFLLFDHFQREQADGFEPKSLAPDDLASIIFTSGSSGRPKGVMLSHKNIVANTLSIADYLSLSESDIVIAVLPFFYVYGKTLLNTHFAVGATVVIENRFLFPNVVLDTIVREKVTGLAGVPSTFTILLNRSSVDKYEFPSLRYVTQAGGPMAPAVIRRLAGVFPGKDIFIMYGATEASARLAYLPPHMLLSKLGSVGRAIPGVKIEIRRKNDSLAKPLETGEIVASGKNIMQGYWRNFDATNKVLRNGRYHTGDLGYIDNDGFLFLTGRIDDMIKVGGNRVSPKEIEDVLFEMPELHEVAIVSVADDILGQVPYAFIVAKNPTPPAVEDVLGHCRQRLASYKIPKYVEFIDRLPKSDAGKIMKGSLTRSCETN